MTASPRRRGLALLLVLMSWSCSAPDTLPGPRATTAARPTLGDPLKISLPPLSWESAPARVGGRRVALLVAVNEYAEPNWNLPFALPSAERLADALEASGAFAPGDILLKSGESVTRDVLRAQLDRLAREFEGPDNTLLVHWVGHGFNIDGQQRFLTWPSRHDGTDYADTLAYGELALWMNDVEKQVEARGGGLRTALVIDACRTRDQNAPGTLRRHRALVDVEAFSAAPGSPAAASPTEDVTLFTAAVADGLRRDGVSRDLRLLPALRRGVEAASAQGALITTGEEDLVLLDADDLSVAVRVVDAATGEPIADATVQLNGKERPSPAVFRDLAETAEGYDLLVRAPGYFWRSHSLHLERERAGALVSVPLRHEFVVLQGRVELRGRGVARVSVTGAFDGLRDGEHSTSQTLTSTSGFRLRVPPTPGPRSLVVELDGSEVRRTTIDLAELPSTLLASGGVKVRVHDLGVHVLEAGERGARVAAGALAAQVGGVDLEFSFDAVKDTDFTDDFGASFFAEVRALVDRGDYDQAARDLRALVENERVRSSSRRKFDALLQEVALAELLRGAEGLQADDDLVGARELLDRSPLREHDKVVPLLVSWFSLASREAQAEERFVAAAGFLGKAVEIAPSRDKFVLRQQLQALLNEAIEAGFRDALKSGAWEGLDPLIEALRKAGGYTPARDWGARILREAIPPRCREFYEAGVAAQSEGDLERAYTEYGRALEARPNKHYLELLGELRSELGAQLFHRFNATGAEHHAGGELRLALEAYMEAWKYDTLVASRIDRLVRNEQLRREDPALVARAEALLAGPETSED